VEYVQKPTHAPILTAPPGPARNREYERWRWQIFAVTWLAYAGFYLTRKSFSVAKVELAKPNVMNWNVEDLAWVDFGYLLAYAVGQVFCGALGDRFGPRKVVLTGIFLSLVTAVLMGASSSLVVFGVLFTIQGLCQSSGWAPLTKNVGEFFSRGERGRVLGFWCSNYAVGGVVASAIAGFAAQHFGWRYAFWAPAGGLLLVWVLFDLFQRNRPEDVGLPPIEEYRGEPADVVKSADTPAAEPEGSWTVIAAVLGNPMVWLLSLEYFLLKPARYLFLFWAPFYVNDRLGSGAAESGILGSLFELGGPLGMILAGYLSDKLFHSRRVPMTALGLLGAGLLVFAFPALPVAPWALGLGLFSIGFFVYVADSLISATAAIDFGTRRGASTAAGLINACGSVGAIVGGTLPGWIKRVAPEGSDLWSWVFYGLGAALLLAALLLVPQWNRLPSPARKAV
jgi:OPA family sugar phosphate sensor protein UhpC-like MFS transporter